MSFFTLLSFYILFGLILSGILIAILRMKKLLTADIDKFHLFTLCCILMIGYPYFAIRAVYLMFVDRARHQIIDAEVIK